MQNFKNINTASVTLLPREATLGANVGAKFAVLCTVARENGTMVHFFMLVYSTVVPISCHKFLWYAIIFLDKNTIENIWTDVLNL